MKNIYCSLFTFCVAFISISLGWAQDSPVSQLPASNSANEYQFQRLVDFKPDSAEPFIVNPAVADDLIKEDNELADAQLKKIKQEIEDLITKHPESPAAKELAELLDKAGLKVIPDHGIYDKGVFCLTVPMTR